MDRLRFTAQHGGAKIDLLNRARDPLITTESPIGFDLEHTRSPQPVFDERLRPRPTARPATPNPASKAEC